MPKDIQTLPSSGDLSIAVAIPCYNEAVTIAKVVKEFRCVLPLAAIHVFDNNSTDGSNILAVNAGAVVHNVRKQGKGNVIRAIFDAVEADALIIVDGDGTYCAEEAPMLLKPVLQEGADMVVGNRLQHARNDSLTRLHEIGNRLIVTSINQMFWTSYKDILSGYRAFSRRFIESVPLLMPGFETETELTLQALSNDMDVVEVPISYLSRPLGSLSKLRTFHDGYRIMLTAVMLLRDQHPLRVYGVFSLVCLVIAVVAFLLRALSYFGIELFPISLLTGLILLFLPLGVVTFGFGLILNAINARFRELSQIIRRSRQKYGRSI
jgi:glycosyltransferase involved in cell wall biosynthesis